MNKYLFVFQAPVLANPVNPSSLEFRRMTVGIKAASDWWAFDEARRLILGTKIELEGAYAIGTPITMLCRRGTSRKWLVLSCDEVLPAYRYSYSPNLLNKGLEQLLAEMRSAPVVCGKVPVPKLEPPPPAHYEDD